MRENARNESLSSFTRSATALASIAIIAVSLWCPRSTAAGVFVDVADGLLRRTQAPAGNVRPTLPSPDYAQEEVVSDAAVAPEKVWLRYVPSGLLVFSVLITLGAVVLLVLNRRLRHEGGQRREAEEIARRHEFITNSIRDPMSLVNRDFVYEAVNESYCYALGRDRRDIVGKTVPQVWGDEAFDQSIRPSFEQCFAGEQKTISTWLEFGRLGNVFFEITYYPYYSEGGDVTHAVVVTRDVTPQKHAEDALIHARDAAEAATVAKSKFLANMSHEIRTPLNAVIGFTHLALKGNLPPKQRDYLNKIESSSQGLLGIINDILDFSKIEAGRIELESIEFRLAGITRQLLDVFGFKAQEKGLQLHFAVDPEVPTTLAGDPLRLRQVLTNLMSNAIKFTESGQITVSAKIATQSADRILLAFSVQDTGIGMTRDQMERVFDAFSQADSTTTRRFGGTGLGLAICSRLVDLMGGQVCVDSKPGEGATFSFTAMFGVPPKDAGRRGSQAPKTLRGMRVLLVDDEEAIRRLLGRVLESLTLRPSVASTAEEGLSMLKDAWDSDPYDVVIMDWQMPGMGGLDAADRIRELRGAGGTPRIVLISGYWDDVLAKSLEAGRVDAFLLKPTSPSSLLETIIQLFPEEALGIADRRMGGAQVPPPDLRGACVLLAEDNDLNQEVALGLLAETGCDVTAVRDGTEAVAAVKSGRFDAVLMDFQMPRMDGFDATKCIREWEEARARDEGVGTKQESGDRSSPGVPIVAMTASAMKEDKERALEAGMNDHVAKPIDPNELFRVLGRWVKPSGALAPRRVESPAPKARATTPPAQDGVTPTRQGLPDLPGIDMDAALTRFRGDATQLLDLLGKFVANHGDAMDDIRTALADGDTETARRAAHTVKGLAGTFAATALESAARDLETALVDSSTTDVAPLVEDLAVRLQWVLDGLSALEPNPEAAPAKRPEEATGDVETEQVAPLVAQLAELLEDGDPDAAAVLDELARLELPDSVTADMAKLRPAIDRYQFEEAQEALARIAADLGISAGGESDD